MAPRRGQAGLTLIELLVVIAVIGAVSSVAVVSIRGFRGSAVETSCAADAAVLERAQAAHEVQHGGSGTEEQLVSSGLLSDESTLHDVSLVGSDHVLVPVGECAAAPEVAAGPDPSTTVPTSTVPTSTVPVSTVPVTPDTPGGIGSGPAVEESVELTDEEQRKLEEQQKVEEQRKAEEGLKVEEERKAEVKPEPEKKGVPATGFKAKGTPEAATPMAPVAQRQTWWEWLFGLLRI